MLRLETFDAGMDRLDSAGAPRSDFRPAVSAVRHVTTDHLPEGQGAAIDRLCEALVSDIPGLAREDVARLRDRGVGVETLIGSFVPRIAARLGEMWIDDTLGFAAVTVAMARLTDIYRTLSREMRRDGDRSGAGRLALFALTPGETHSLGVLMAADRFERAGWAVRVELQADTDALVRIAGRHRFDLIGLSAGSRRMIPVLTETVAGLRSATDAAIPILVGGPACAFEPDLAERTGADTAYHAADAALAAVAARPGRAPGHPAPA